MAIAGRGGRKTCKCQDLDDLFCSEVRGSLVCRIFNSTLRSFSFFMDQ